MQPSQMRRTEADDWNRSLDDKRKACLMGQVVAFELERKQTLPNMGDLALLQLVAKAFLVGTA